MGLTINTNISAMSAQRNLSASSAASASSLAKLSSGSRVPTAREDAAALSIGTGLRLESSALRAAQVNAQQASSMLQIADGSFGQITDILARMKSLATTSMSGQLSNVERGFLDTEFTELVAEIDRIAATTEFNGVSLLGGSSNVELDATSTGLNANGGTVGSNEGFVGFDFDQGTVSAGDTFTISFDQATDQLSLGLQNGAGDIIKSQTLDISGSAPSVGTTAALSFDNLGVTVTINDIFDLTADVNVGFATTGGDFDIASSAGAVSAAATLDFQVGSGTTSNDQIQITTTVGNYTAIAGGAAVGVDSVGDATTSMGQIDTAVAAVNDARAGIGAKMNRLDFAQSNLAVNIENTEAARSTLMDVDVSAEITEFTSKQVLIQAGVSMLAQANQQPSLLLRLLQ